MVTVKMDKATFMLTVTIWNLVAVYVGSLEALTSAVLALIIGIGNAVIIWVGVETGNEPEETQTTALNASQVAEPAQPIVSQPQK